MKPERVPEQQDVGREKQQRDDRQEPSPDAGDGAAVERHEERQRDRHRGVDVDERVRAVFLEEKPVSNGFREQKRRHDDRDVEERQKDRQTLARPDVEEAAQPLQHGVFGSLLQFLHRIGSPHVASSAGARTHRRRTAGRNRHDAADVRLFIPGDGRLQHRQAGHAIAIHRSSSAPTTSPTCSSSPG